MKILMFGWEYPPHNSGGLGTACKGLASALVKKGIDLKFVLPKKLEVEDSNVNFIFAEEVGGFSYKNITDTILGAYKTSSSLTSSQQNVKNKNDALFNDYFRNLLSDVLIYAKNAKVVAEENDFDVIHVHDWLCIKAGMEAKSVSHKPLIVHVHATEFDRSGDHINEAIYEIEKEGFEAADKIICVSNFTKKIVVEKYYIDERKVIVAYNGLEMEEVDDKEIQKIKVLNELKDQGYNLVLFLGRFTFQKNPDIILRAAVDILKYKPKTLFIFAGSGDMERQLIEMAARLGISDKVIFAGFVRGNEKHRLFRIADVFLMPSISEPFGIVPLESLANNTPVIISKQSGISEVLENSLKVDFWDVDEIVNKVVAVLHHSALKDNLTTNGHNELSKFSWEKAADICVRCYETLY